MNIFWFLFNLFVETLVAFLALPTKLGVWVDKLSVPVLGKFWSMLLEFFTITLVMFVMIAAMSFTYTQGFQYYMNLGEPGSVYSASVNSIVGMFSVEHTTLWKMSVFVIFHLIVVPILLLAPILILVGKEEGQFADLTLSYAMRRQRIAVRRVDMMLRK